ncbi:hypothetical protein H4P1_00095 (plasmid) [Variovorax sp. PBS-H4]|nr:hypothetical protein H4P1_00095 [Variovorax sp. PBS-H4]
MTQWESAWDDGQMLLTEIDEPDKRLHVQCMFHARSRDLQKQLQ